MGELADLDLQMKTGKIDKVLGWNYSFLGLLPRKEGFE